MSRDFPALIDPWQMAKGRRGFKGDWPLGRFKRLGDLVADTKGLATFEVEFGIDALGISYLDLTVEARPTLICQRTLVPFEFELRRSVRLGLLGTEADMPALPPDYEPLVVPEEPVQLMDLVEDEMILALPLVPKSGDQPVDTSFGPAVETTEQDNPFAVLARLKEQDISNKE